jgi:carboxylesterase
MTPTDRRHIRLEGNDYAVLALHGLRSTPLELQPVLKALNHAGFTVDAPHLTGFGFSQDSSIGTWQEWLTQALAQFDALAATHRQVAVCGLSMGATLALAVAAIRGKAVCALAPFSTTLFYDGWNTPWYRFLRPLAYYTPLRHTWVMREASPFGLKNVRLRKWVARQVATGPVSVIGASGLTLPALHQAEKLMRYTRRNLQNITTPTLILHSNNDDIASLKSAYLVQKKVASRDVRLIQFADSYHMLTLDNEREQVAALTSNFFKEYRHQAMDAAPEQTIDPSNINKPIR